MSNKPLHATMETNIDGIYKVLIRAKMRQIKRLSAEVRELKAEQKRDQIRHQAQGMTCGNRG